MTIIIKKGGMVWLVDGKRRMANSNGLGVIIDQDMLGRRLSFFIHVLLQIGNKIIEVRLSVHPSIRGCHFINLIHVLRQIGNKIIKVRPST